jgi:hypothetical protein
MWRIGEQVVRLEDGIVPKRGTIFITVFPPNFTVDFFCFLIFFQFFFCINSSLPSCKYKVYINFSLIFRFLSAFCHTEQNNYVNTTN